MDAEKLIDDLIPYEGMPVAGIEAVRANRGEAIPLLLDLVNRLVYPAKPESEMSIEEIITGDDDDQAVFFAVHLLAECRETRAFRPLLDLLSEPERAERLLGEAMTETLPQILISTFDGDWEALEAAIRGAKPNDPDFARAALLDAWTYYAVKGGVSHEHAVAFLGTWAEREPDSDSPDIWHSWLKAVCMLRATACRDHAARVCETVAPMGIRIMNPEDVDRLMEKVAAAEDIDALLAEERLYPLEDVVAELSDWTFGYDTSDLDELEAYSFSNEMPGYDAELAPLVEWARRPTTAGQRGAGSASAGAGAPTVNPFRNVGRNDPCPCGSGKKAKKCCLK